MACSMSVKPTHNKRAHDRFAIALEVKVVFADNHRCTLKTRDISHNGVFLEMGEGELPETGTRIQMQVQDMFSGDDAPLVEGEVVRRTADGIGVRFLTD